MILRATRRCAQALVRPFARLARRETPQWRWCLATVLRSVGMAAGVLGIRVDHH
jgi:hypothetical protein